ncbi:MAG: hypothetical protein PHQ33_03180 [Bacteroidales bacterium]|nr:hypothetical protein [Bacteroidales bacterium]
METIRLRDRQTIFDVALQACGSAEAAFDIARMNDISISELLPAGTILKIPEVDSSSKRVVDYYDNTFYPATGEETSEEPESENAIMDIMLETPIVLINGNEIINIE